jgi:16S rRNA C967 or C1407 C5-methylase (RsmB/RsmF family)
VAVAPARSRGLVNAVLRRVADALVEWPDEATRLSYPDWVVGRLVADLGEADALAVLEEMDRPAEPVERPDGYVQDRASQLVVAAMAAGAGERVADVCAGPGGKATLLAGSGARVLATDVRPARAGLVAGAAERTPTAGARRFGRDRSIGSWWTPRAPAWACSVGGRTPAGGSGPPPSGGSPASSGSSSTPPSRSSAPAAP